MQKSIALRTLAVAALASVALTACGSSSNPSSGGTPTAPGSKTADTTASGGSGGNSDFSKLVAQASTARYKVTYQASGKTLVIAQDPPKYSFIEGDTALYGLADGTYVSCDGTGSSATCTQVPGSGDALKQSLAGAFGAFGAGLLTSLSHAGSALAGVSTSDKTIAGRDARCATLDATKLGALAAGFKGSFTVCVDKKTGVMLRTSTTGVPGDDEIVATAFGDPSDSDFTPPSTPVTIPGLDTTPST